MEAKINQLAPVEDFDKAYIVAQYAHEQGFRGTTFLELLSWLQTRLDLTGTDLIDPTPPGTEANPAVIPPGPEGKKGKFEPSPGFYQGFPEVTGDRRWYFYWDGSSWTLVDMGAMPDNAAKAKDWQAEEEYDRNTIVTHNDFQWIALVDTDEEPTQESTAWVKFSPTPLKDEWDIETQMGLSGEGIGKGIVNNFQGGQDKVASAADAKELDERVRFYDRPDLPFYYPVFDKSNRVTDRILSENFDGKRMLPTGYGVSDLDRPDLGAVILVDKDNRLLGETGQQGEDGRTKADTAYNLPLWNPKQQEAFNIPAAGDDNSILGNYDVLIDSYDSIMQATNINAHIPHYIVKDSIGTSSAGEIPIYRYKLIPPSPKLKILVIGGTHANEKMYIQCVYELFKAIVEDWETNDFLYFLRWHVEVHILPCRSPYSISNDVRKRGFRVTAETPPIPMSWTKTDNTVRITYDVADFPDSEFLDGETYLTSVPENALVNRASIGIITSSDESALPLDAYRFSRIVAGNSFEIEVPDSGTASGSGSIQVWTDPNRNWNNENSSRWFDFVGALTPQPSDAGYTVGHIDNKGTQPMSLSESRALFDILMEENYDFAVDGHSPAGDHYHAFYRETGYNPDLNRMAAESGNFVSSPMDWRDMTGTGHSTMPANIMAYTYNKNYCTVEWGSGLYNATSKEVRDALRWLGICIKDLIIYTLKK